mmetsp:Transcript_12140/g.26251  ORF Transcript_12140/g.26251 Transcript_12140/m.26251 type:complete len:88 (-) Transcript_12140:185-448(-)
MPRIRYWRCCCCCHSSGSRRGKMNGANNSNTGSSSGGGGGDNNNTGAIGDNSGTIVDPAPLMAARCVPAPLSPSQPVPLYHYPHRQV